MKDLLKNIQEKIIALGYEAVINYDLEKIQVKYPKNLESYSLLIGFPVEFPYKFPLIQITEELRDRVDLKSHVATDNYLCLEFTGKEVVNPTKPIDVAIYTFGKAVELIDKAINDNANKERYNELSSYWGLCKRKIAYNCYSFYDDNEFEGNVEVGFYYLDSTNLFILNKKNDYVGECYIKHFTNYNPNLIKKCLNLKVVDSKEAFALRDFESLLDFLKSKDEDYINSYFEEHPEKGLINLIVQSDKSKVYSVYYKKNTKKKRKSSGFREIYKCVPFYFIPNDFTKNKLFERSSSEWNEYGESHVCIVGCGSLGSELAENLANTGTTEFTLIDNDIFNNENLLRHVCGSKSIGSPKTIALKNYLLNNYPYLKINTFQKSIYKISESELSNSISKVFIATGEIGSEYFCLNSFFNKKEVSQVLLLWLDPYATAGHIISYDKENWSGSFDDLYNRQIELKSIINASDFYKQEAGCSSAYIPYSGIDIKIFLSSYIKYSSKIPYKAFSFTKILNISKARQDKRMMISKEYDSVEDGEVILKKHDKN